VPGLDIRLALGRVRDDVVKSTSNKQEPFVYGSLGGDAISLAPAPSEPKNEASAAAKSDYALAERIGTQKAWETFLATHKDGLHAELARAQLAKLLQTGSKAAASTESSKPQTAALAPAEAVAPPKQAAPRLEEPRVAKAGDESEACSRDKQKLDLLRANTSQGWAREDLKRLERTTTCDRVRAEAGSLLLGTADIPPRTAPSPQQQQQPGNALSPVLSAIAELRRVGCVAGQADPALNETVTNAVRSYLAEKGRSDDDIKVVERLLADLKAENKRLCAAAAQAQ
jgi:hypothetical protein